MTVASAQARTQAAEPPIEAPDAQPPSPGFGQTLAALQGELSNAVHERLHLAALEFRQLSVNATQMVMLAMAAGLMLASAWVAALIAVYRACTEQGMPWGAALLLVMALNLACAATVWARAMALSQAFTFPATRRMLHRREPGAPEV